MESDASGIAALYCLPASTTLTAITSRSVVDTLRLSVDRRNEWRGHDAAIAPAERRRRIYAMTELIVELRRALGGSLDRWGLLQPVSVRPTATSHEVEALLLVGPNPRPRTRRFEFNHAVRADRLYASALTSSRALELVPLIRLDRRPDSADTAIYFLDRVTKDGLRWLSYDAPHRPELETPLIPEVTMLVSDLDAPSSSVDDPGSEANNTRHPPQVQSRDAVIRDPLAAVIAGITTAIPRVMVRHIGDMTSVANYAPLGVLELRGGTYFATANVPMEVAANAPGALLTEIPVTTDSRPGTEIPLDCEGAVQAAIANLVLADAQSPGPAPRIGGNADQLAGVLGGDVILGRGDQVSPPFDRLQLEHTFDRIEQRIQVRPALNAHPVRRWPRELRLAAQPWLTLSIVPDPRTTIVEVALTAPVGQLEFARIARSRHVLSSIGVPFSVRRYVDSVAVLAWGIDPVGPSADDDAIDQVLNVSHAILNAVRELVEQGQ
jgi:hypothetical protein